MKKGVSSSSCIPKHRQSFLICQGLGGLSAQFIQPHCWNDTSTFTTMVKIYILKHHIVHFEERLWQKIIIQSRKFAGICHLKLYFTWPSHSSSSQVILNVTWMKTQCKMNHSKNLKWFSFLQSTYLERKSDNWQPQKKMKTLPAVLSTAGISLLIYFYFYFHFICLPRQACHASSEAVFEEEVSLWLCR